MVDKTVLAYLAGMIDGDGYITVTRSTRSGKIYFGPQVGIAGTRREPHDLASSIWGGKVSLYHPKNPFHRGQYQWSRQDDSAVPIIEAIYPYLLVKKEQASLALDLFEHMEGKKNKENQFPWFGPEYSPIPYMEKIREEMISLNQSRNRVERRKFREVGAHAE